MSHKSSSSPVRWTCKQHVSACAWLLACKRKSFCTCGFFNLARSEAMPACRTHTNISTCTHTNSTQPQVIFILAHSRWESKNNNQVWLHILFSQTSSKLSPSPSCRVLWASSNSQHQSHFIRPARLSPPLFPGKCLTSPPQTQSKLKEGLSAYVVWYPLIVCAAGRGLSWSRKHTAHVGD